MEEKETVDASADVEAWGQSLAAKPKEKKKTRNDIDFFQNSRAAMGFFHHCAHCLFYFFPFVLNICLFILW